MKVTSFLPFDSAFLVQSKIYLVVTGTFCIYTDYDQIPADLKQQCYSFIKTQIKQQMKALKLPKSNKKPLKQSKLSFIAQNKES